MAAAVTLVAVRNRGVLAFAAACLGALAVAFVGAPPASASNVTAALSMNGAIVGGSRTGAIGITAGDSVTFVLGPPPNGLTTGFYVVVQANPAGGLNSNRTLKKGDSVTLVFPSAGSWSFTWRGYNGLNIRLSGSPSVTVLATAPDPGTPDPGSSAPGGGGGTSGGPSGTGGSSGGVGGVPTLPSGSGTGTRAGAGGAGGHGAGFSFGPHPDTGSVAQSTAAGTSSANIPTDSSDDRPTPYVTTSVVQAQNVSDNSNGGAPAGLAIISILVFAGVGVAFAFQQFGPGAAAFSLPPVLQRFLRRG